jgi:hypothetical protein
VKLQIFFLSFLSFSFFFLRSQLEHHTPLQLEWNGLEEDPF